MCSCHISLLIYNRCGFRCSKFLLNSYTSKPVKNFNWKSGLKLYRAGLKRIDINDRLFMHSGYGIKATRIKRMTPQKPFTGQKGSPKHAISRNGLVGIFRAGWIETTSGSQDWRQYDLVKLDKKQYGLFNDQFFLPTRQISFPVRKMPVLRILQKPSSWK